MLKHSGISNYYIVLTNVWNTWLGCSLQKHPCRNSVVCYFTNYWLRWSCTGLHQLKIWLLYTKRMINSFTKMGKLSHRRSQESGIDPAASLFCCHSVKHLWIFSTSLFFSFWTQDSSRLSIYTIYNFFPLCLFESNLLILTCWIPGPGFIH